MWRQDEECAFGKRDDRPGWKREDTPQVRHARFVAAGSARARRAPPPYGRGSSPKSRPGTAPRTASGRSPARKASAAAASPSEVIQKGGFRQLPSKPSFNCVQRWRVVGKTAPQSQRPMLCPHQAAAVKGPCGPRSRAFKVGPAVKLSTFPRPARGATADRTHHPAGRQAPTGRHSAG